MTIQKSLAVVCLTALPAVACVNAAHAQTAIDLDPTWSEWDPENLQTLSGQSATGYTTSISGVASETGAISQVYQIFDPVSLSNVGDKVEFAFDIQFHNALGAVNLDTDFRFGISSTANNSGAVYGVDAGGNAGGTTVRLRYDENGITWIGDPGDVPGTGYPNAFDENNMNHSLNAAGTLGSVGSTPNGLSGNVLGEDTSEIHSFIATLERVGSGLSATFEWSNDVPGATPITTSFTYDDSGLEFGPTNSIDMIQIALLEENISATYPTSWTVSNVELTHVPEPTSLALLGLGGLMLARRRR